MTVNEYLKKMHPGFGSVAPAIVCCDGFEFSVQASKHHYCSPRVDNCPSYDAVEVGFPSCIEPLLTPFAADGVYPQVPVSVVDQIIAKHGGIKL
jgi:hypothetical protein